MSDESKSFEKKLDRDFLFYLNLAKGLYDKITDATEKQLCEVWLTNLVGKNFRSVGEKCDRNIFISRLLLQMQNGKLEGIFQETPPSGALPSAFTTFGLPSDVEGLRGYEETGFQVDKTIAGGSGDFAEASRDGRTYLATKSLPHGVMAFIAITNNDGQEIWRPHPCPAPGTSQPAENRDKPEKEDSEFVKRLMHFVKMPLCHLRKSPEERERVIEWMDKIIEDCNKWIQGIDPHNKYLESLFEMLYQEYKNDPEKKEILNHQKKLRTILMKDIRDKMYERRAEVSKRELILDQYESDQYNEERLPGIQLDEVWLQCAKKPIAESIKTELDFIYPPEVVKRFSELLYQERIHIIEKGEKEASKKIYELKSGSVDDIKNELQKLKKVQQDYKEYYSAYKDVEAKEAEYAKEWKERCSKSDKPDQPQKGDKLKREIECKIEQSKRNFEEERKAQHDLVEQLNEANEYLIKVEKKLIKDGEKLNCKRNQLQIEKENIQLEIAVLKRKQDELRCKLMNKGNRCIY